MKQIRYILILLLLCSSVTGCAAVIGAAIGGAAIATTGSIVASRTEEPVPISDNPYPVEYKRSNRWMENHLMCPNGKTFTLEKSDRSKQVIICPYHKQEINVEEAKKRYYYYYYAKRGVHPLPIQYLTEKDKKIYEYQPMLKEKGDE